MQAVRNMNGTVTETAYFFHNSAKRQCFLEKVVDGETTTVKVKDLCAGLVGYIGMKRTKNFSCCFHI